MPIGSAIESDTQIIVYDETGSIITAIPRGFGPKDGLQGYTAATVSVRSGANILIYDGRGHLIRAVPV